MATARQQVQLADAVICANIDALPDQRALLSQNVLAQLRNLVEATAVWLHEGNADAAFQFDKIKPAIRHAKAIARYRFLGQFHDWLQQIAVFTAVDFLRRRKRRRWLRFFDQQATEEPAGPAPDEAGQEALRATYRVLDRLNAEERSVFALRFIDGMDIDALANAHDCSRSTIKRRLARATSRFRALAQREGALAPWLAGTEQEDEGTS